MKTKLAPAGLAATAPVELRSPSAGPVPNLIDGATYTDIADSTMIAPGQTTNFSSFFPAIGGDKVAFLANQGGGKGIYTGVAGTTGASLIVDTTQIAPGQSTKFTKFDDLASSGGSVAFRGYYNVVGNPSGVGMYTGVAGTAGVIKLADYATAVPGQSTVFTMFDKPVVSGSDVAFLGYYNAGTGKYSGTGIYLGVAGAPGLTRFADLSTTVPGQPTVFTGFGTPAINGGNIAFPGYYKVAATAGVGIYTGAVGSTGLSRVADYSTTVPGQPTTFASLGSPAISGNNLVFNGGYYAADGSFGTGVYTGTLGVTGASLVADTTMTVPGQSTVFTSFYGPVISGRNVGFRGYYDAGSGASSGSGFYLGMAGTTGVSRIVDSSTPVPGQATTFTGYDDLAISGDNIAFLGTFGGGSGSTIQPGGIFLYHNGVLLNVIETGDPLLGNNVQSLTFDPAGLNGDTLTFTFTLNDLTRGVMTVTVPEPATALGGALSLVAAALVLVRRARAA